MSIVPTNLPSIFATLDILTTLQKNAIVRPNNPPPGIAGFLFDVRTEETVQLQSDITDHYIENNTAIQDQIGLKPETVQLRGVVAELAQTNFQQDEVTKEVDALPVNESLEPEYTEIQIKEFAEKEQVKEQQVQAITKDQSLNGYFNARTSITRGKQAKVFEFFYQLWKGRQLMTIDTPFGFFTDMAIESLRVNQNEESKYISDFNVTFKKIRFAQNVVIKQGQLAGRRAQQAADKTQNGVAGKEDITTTKNQSWLYQLSR